MTLRFIVGALALSVSLTSFAEDLDDGSKEALEKTQKLLKSKSERDEFIKNDSNARKADDQVNKLSDDPTVRQGAYEASADILSDLVKQTGGDAEKMKKLLEEAAANPEAFYKNLSPAQQAQIRDLANKIEKKNKPIGSPR